MNKHKSSSELKSLAKGQLLGKYGILIGAMVLQTSIVMVLQLFIATFFPTTILLGTFLYYIISILVTLFSGIFTAGISLMYLRTACSYRADFQDVFWGFQHHAGRIMLLQFPLALLETLCMVPAYILQYRMQAISYLDMKSYLLYIIATFAGSLVFTILQLAFSQVFFLLLDFPQYSAMDLYKMSIRIMKGHKLRLLYIELSFIPLYLLSFCTCGIALLWIIPYKGMTEANFYLDLMAHRNHNQ